ncbi:PQQ-binding-like beta-propeller repeat protein, partial [bacterium]|nr:PQQ-binding-like beta-propeller repeat protein [bacterium]
MKRSFYILPILILGILFSTYSYSQLAQSAWPMFKRDFRHSGNSPHVGPQNPLEKWKFKAAQKVSSSPAIGFDGTIYFGSDDGFLYTLLHNGTMIWVYNVYQPITSSPSIDSNGVIYLSSAEKLFALNSDGTLHWSLYLIGETDGSSPAIWTDGTIYITTIDDRPATCNLYAINPNGTQKWKYSYPPYPDQFSDVGSPAVGYDGVIYFSAGIESDKGYLFAINSNGTLKWKFETDGGTCSSPAVAPDGTSYIGTDQGNFYAINSN